MKREDHLAVVPMSSTALQHLQAVARSGVGDRQEDDPSRDTGP